MSSAKKGHTEFIGEQQQRGRGLHGILYFLLSIVLVSACASLGTPDGGPYDETPPRVVQAQPENQATNVNRKKISILFDEYIKIENASEKVIVSPPQTEMANVRADGKRIKIELFDTLRPNTTYTIDFADAIVDNNESNPMGNFTYSFSTGDEIDTMEVSGYVLNAADLEPIKGILVGLYEVQADSLTGDSLVPDSFLRTRSFDRVSRTNGSGRFVIKGIARNRRYRAFALQDMDNDFRFSQKSELVAFDTTLFVSTCRPDIRLDTVWRDSTHYDSIQPVRYTHFFPDDIVLFAFLEAGQDRHRLKEERLVPEHFTFYFTAPADTLPRIRGISFEGDGGFIVEPSLQGDTVDYWITDTTIAYCDSLQFEFSYLETDTLGQLIWTTDTVELAPKVTRAQQLKEIQEQTEKWEKEQKKKQKRNKNLPPEENPFLVTYIAPDIKPAGSVDPNQAPLLTFPEPILDIDSSGIHFQLKVDTIWQDAPFELLRSELSPRRFQLYVDWELGQQYRLIIDSAAVHGALGHWNREIKQDLRVRKEEEYGALFMHVITPDTGVVVQLLSGADAPIRTERASADGRADFFYLRPGEYYVRCFVDRNGDGEWTTGHFDSGLHPEPTYYFPKAISVKAQWELEQDWELRGIAPMRQKPAKITKQKPDKDRKVKERNKQREAEMRKRSSKKR